MEQKEQHMHKVWGVRGNKISNVGVGRGSTTQGPPWGVKGTCFSGGLGFCSRLGEGHTGVEVI